MTRSDDEEQRIDEALRLDDDLDVRPSRERFDSAALVGRRRRRRKVAVIGVGAAVALVAVGAATLFRGAAPERLVSTDDPVVTTTEPTVSPTTVLPTTVSPTTVSPTTVLPKTSPPPTSMATTVPGVGVPVTGAPNDLFVTVSGDRAVIDVRTAVDVVASFDLTCRPEVDCVVQSARVMGDTIWVAIVDFEPGDARLVTRSRVISVLPATGEVVEHLSLEGTAAVRSAGRGADGRLYAFLDGQVPGDRALVTIESGQPNVLETSVAGFRLSDDGRFLAVSFSDPPTSYGTVRFEISDLVDGTSVGYDTVAVNAGPGAWSPDGRSLIVNEQWEDGTAWVVDPWAGTGDPLDGTGDPRTGTDGLLDGACFMSDRVVAHRTWRIGYGQGDAQLGVIRLVSLDDGSTVGEFGVDLYGDALQCHPDGSVSYLRRPVIEVVYPPDFTQLEPDFDAPVELVHIAIDGTTTVRAAGSLRMV